MQHGGDLKCRFGQTIRKLREERGMTQEKLAQLSQMSRKTLFDIECGHRNISLESIENLAVALDISITAIFDTLDHLYEEDYRATTSAVNYLDRRKLKYIAEQLQCLSENITTYINAPVQEE